MRWAVEFHDEFVPEFHGLHERIQDEIYAIAHMLEQFGPQLGRPRVDTLNGSRHANMKEMRFSAADGEWRLRLRPLAQRYPSGCGRQVGRQLEALLPHPRPQGRPTL